MESRNATGDRPRSLLHGPYHSDSQASADAKAAGHTIEAARARRLPAMSKDLLCDALKEAGVELGAYDVRIVDWLAHGESTAIMAITGWIERAPPVVRAALYARVSTRDKDQDPQTQLRPMREYAIARGWTTTEYVDFASAGNRRRRTAWAEVLADARRRRIDLLIAWKLDRCFRSSLDAHSTLLELKDLHVGVRFHTQEIDTTTASGRMVYAMLAAVAEFERELISERTAAALERVRAEGKRIGRPPSRPIEEHRRWPEVRNLVLAGTLTKAEGGRRLRVRYRTFVDALRASENGGAPPQLGRRA